MDAFKDPATRSKPVRNLMAKDHPDQDRREGGSRHGHPKTDDPGFSRRRRTRENAAAASKRSSLPCTTPRCDRRKRPSFVHPISPLPTETDAWGSAGHVSDVAGNSTLDGSRTDRNGGQSAWCPTRHKPPD